MKILRNSQRVSWPFSEQKPVKLSFLQYEYVTIILLTFFILSPLSGCVSASQPNIPMDFSDPVAVSTQDEADSMRFDEVQITTGFGILYLDGFTSAETERTACEGSMGTQPEHLFQVNDSTEFKLVLQSSFDLVIGIENEAGEMTCGEAPNAIHENITITNAFEPGQYRVFVGTQAEPDSYMYRIILSE